MKMTENQKKWIAALKSGEYKQHTGGLHWKSEHGDQYCCLGVACELASKDGVKVGRDTDGRIVGGYLMDQPDACAWLGLKEDVSSTTTPPEFRSHGTAAKLAQMNDIELLSFEEIAQTIEAKPEAFFTQA